MLLLNELKGAANKGEMIKIKISARLSRIAAALADGARYVV